MISKANLKEEEGKEALIKKTKARRRNYLPIVNFKFFLGPYKDSGDGAEARGSKVTEKNGYEETGLGRSGRVR